jgi:hypothetical protein
LSYSQAAGQRRRPGRSKAWPVFPSKPRLRPHNLFLQNDADDYEFSFHFDGPMPDFKRLTVECLTLGYVLRTQSIFLQVPYSEFKPSPDGRSFASSRHRATMMLGGHTGAKCKLYKVEP